MTTQEVTRRASTIVEDLELWLAGGKPNYPRIAAAHGWPDLAAVRENIAALKPLGDLTVTFELPTEPEKKPMPTSPARPAPTPADAPATTQVSVHALLVTARGHDRAPIRKTAEKIDALIARLRAELDADRADAVRRKEIADLEARLAELKGKKPSAGIFPCGFVGCGASFDTKQGVTMHNTRTHQDG